ncbi:MAG: 16S rRNA (cytidine(1402)-2'-O)-methyltransferase [Acidimicrobiales bacterium]
MTAALVLVATPIGNLGDLSPRAVEELAGAALVCCEDTRRTGRLLAHAGVKAARLRRVDEHTEADAAAEVLDTIAAGGRVVLVSDAGTPGVSDPGAPRLRGALGRPRGHCGSRPGRRGRALVASGLAADRFVFEGFLPRKGPARRRRLAEVAVEPRTIVIYEAPARLEATLADLAAACGPDRQAAVGRELTKLHEEFARGSLEELVGWAAQRAREMVIVVEGAPPPPEATDEVLVDALVAACAAGLSRKRRERTGGRAVRRGTAAGYQLALGIPGGVTPPS